MNTQQESNEYSGNTGSRLASSAVLGFILLFVLLLYTVIHEGGHALTGLLFGGTLTSFSVNFWNLTAHVGITGTFSETQRSVLSLAGVAFPLLVWGMFIASTPRQTNPAMEWFKLVSSLGVLNSLLPWIVIPFAVFGGNAPGDDATRFLNHSHLSPLLVAAACTLVYVGGWTLFVARMGGLNRVVAIWRDGLHGLLAPASRKTLWTMATIGGVTATLALGLSTSLSQNSESAVPTGYALVAEVDLSQSAYANRTAYAFFLEQPAQVHLFILMQHIESGPAKISLVGSNGYVRTLLRSGREFQAGRATVHPRDLMLEPGEYQLHLTFPQELGQVRIYRALDVPVAEHAQGEIS